MRIGGSRHASGNGSRRCSRSLHGSSRNRRREPRPGALGNGAWILALRFREDMLARSLPCRRGRTTQPGIAGTKRRMRCLRVAHWRYSMSFSRSSSDRWPSPGLNRSGVWLRYAGSLLSVSPGPDSHRRRGASGGEDTLPAPFIPPPLDFAGDPAALSAVAEALRLAHGHQFHPAPPAIPRMFSPARLAGVPRATKAQGSNGRPAPSRCDREGHDWRPAPLPGRSERWARKRW